MRDILKMGIHVPRSTRFAALLVALVAIAAGCGASGHSDPNAIDGTFDIGGGRSLYLACSGKGSPTVVMDAGLGNTHETWHAVAPAVSKLTRTCTYDRANLGESDAAPKPRTSADVVADLRRLLRAARVAPPYLLVGHSFGGLNVRLFASDHPGAVAGIILVDPTPTAFLRRECALVSASLCEELRRGWGPGNNPDGLDFVISGREVERAAALPRVPLVVLAATVHQQAAITDAGVEAKIETMWRGEERKLAASVPQGTITLVQSGHDIQELHPGAVIAALTAMLAQGAP